MSTSSWAFHINKTETLCIWPKPTNINSQNMDTPIFLPRHPPQPTTQKETNPHVHLNQCVSLSLVCPIPPNNTGHPVPQSMAPLFREFVDVFQPPTGLPPPSHAPHRSLYKYCSMSFITQCPYLPTSSTKGKGN